MLLEVHLVGCRTRRECHKQCCCFCDPHSFLFRSVAFRETIEGTAKHVASYDYKIRFLPRKSCKVRCVLATPCMCPYCFSFVFVFGSTLKKTNKKTNVYHKSHTISPSWRREDLTYTPPSGAGSALCDTTLIVSSSRPNKGSTRH